MLSITHLKKVKTERENQQKIEQLNEKLRTIYANYSKLYENCGELSKEHTNKTENYVRN